MSSPTYDTGVSQINAGVDPIYGHLIHILPTSQAGRYLRLELTDSSLTYIEAGRLFAGIKFQPGHNFAYDYKRTTLDSVRMTESEGGQTWVEVGVQRGRGPPALRGVHRLGIPGRPDRHSPARPPQGHPRGPESGQHQSRTRLHLRADHRKSQRPACRLQSAFV